MTPVIADWHIVALLAGFALAIPLSLAIDAISQALARRRARRRDVRGSRVNAPAWRARKLTNGSWIVERRK
jgi:hypothetical protein